MSAARYFIAARLGDDWIEHEVTKDEFVAHERSAGFVRKPSLGSPNEPATGGFMNSWIRGRIEEEIA